MTSAKSLFPPFDAIPAEHRVQIPYTQREYLIHGEVKAWGGALQPVLSPICVQNGDAIEQVALGHYPLLSKQEALEALASAQAAFNDGLGEWPAMNFRERLARLERFVVRMQERRSEVVRLIMWEIGKT